MASSGHLPGCRVVTYREMAEKWSEPLPPHLDTGWADTAGVMACVDGCPDLERALARGRELAAEHGW